MLPSLRPSPSALRFLVVTLLLLPAPLWLQSQVSTPSQLSGVVVDQTGAVIAAVEVVFTSGSFTTTQVTDERGDFVFSQVPTESGVVTVSATGFQVRSIDWHADTSWLAITLLPATTAEQVTVTANRTGVRLVENATSVTVLSAPDLQATAAFRV